MPRKVVSSLGPLKVGGPTSAQFVGPVVSGGNIAKALAGVREKQDVLGLPNPVVPKAVAYQDGQDGLLVFDGHSLTIELTDPIRTKGKAPVLVSQEYEGRRPKVAMDPAPLGSATVSLICRDNAQQVHDVIMARCAAGHVLRVYGPMVGPYGQGDVWAFSSMPEPDTMNVPLLGGRLQAFKLTIELTEWDPMGSLVPQTGSRVGTDGPRRMASMVGPQTANTAGIFDAQNILGQRYG